MRQTVYRTNEFNSLIGHQGGVLSVSISTVEKFFATGSNDKTVSILKRNGAYLKFCNRRRHSLALLFVLTGAYRDVEN
ncbi:MAG: WD40 domain-containing protein [Calothrix sp. FI2-JRJ7]|nr:WD40 domain-containing protein [Calothrix sp. FI2-JRJ7]